MKKTIIALSTTIVLSAGLVLAYKYFQNDIKETMTLDFDEFDVKE